MYCYYSILPHLISLLLRILIVCALNIGFVGRVFAFLVELPPEALVSASGPAFRFATNASHLNM